MFLRSILLVAVCCLWIGNTDAQNTCSYTGQCSRPNTRCSWIVWGSCWGYSTTTTYYTCARSTSCATSWNEWSTCSKTCGGGIQTRNGTCVAGKTCSSNVDQTRACNEKDCPQNGGWSNWGPEVCTACSATCGPSSRTCTKTRTCTNPPPRYGGDECGDDDKNVENEICLTNPCPIHGNWTRWSDWDCSECSNMFCSRSRTCTQPPPKYGGKQCEGGPAESKYDDCSPEVCHDNGGWSEFGTDWSCGECSRTCGEGEQTCHLTRTCIHPPCSGEDRVSITKMCNKGSCPEWSAWYNGRCGACQSECGPGTRECRLMRFCIGGNCEGPTEKWESDDCDAGPCKVAGGWSEYEAEKICGQCSTTCGAGTRTCTRIRHCNSPAPQNGGDYCRGSSTLREEEDCNVQACAASAPTCRVNCHSVADGVDAFFPDPIKCNAYSRCYDQTQYDLTCNSGLYWNDAEKKCDWPSRVRCNMCTDGELSCQKTNGDIECASPEDGCQNGAKEIEFGAPILGNCLAAEEGLRVQDGNVTCGGYYWCVNSWWIHMPCAPGTHYNGTVCGHDDCADNPSPPVDCVEDSKFPDGSLDCSGYTLCDNRRLVYFECNTGYMFDREAGECKVESDVECPGKRGDSGNSGNVCDGHQHGDHVANDRYCNLFYHCVHGTPVAMSCGDKEPFFDPTLGVCVHAEDSDCVPGDD